MQHTNDNTNINSFDDDKTDYSGEFKPKFFTPREPTQAERDKAFDLKLFRMKSMSKVELIRHMILEEGDVETAFQIAGEEIEALIRRSIRKHEDEDEGSGSGGVSFSIDFSEIGKAADKLTHEQLQLVLVLYGLFGSIFENGKIYTFDYLSMK